MTATERLRELLDERGVEWTSGDTEVSRNICTDFCPDAGVSVSVWENDGKLGIDVHTLYRFTPEQAIAATLGPGTCHNTQFAEMDEKADKKHRMAIASVLCGGVFPEDEPAEFTCSTCGNTALIDWVTLYDIRFCPFCGAKVVSE